MKNSTSNTNSDGPEPRLPRYENHTENIRNGVYKVEENCYGNKRNREGIT